MIKDFANKNINLILLLAFIGGLFMPDPGPYSSITILFLLFAIIFFSFFQFELTADTFKDSLKLSLIYSVWRCFLLPLAFAIALLPFKHSDYYIAIILLTLLPAAVSSPAITAMLKGDFNASISNLVITSFFVTLSIPLYFLFLLKSAHAIQPWILFRTLIFTIILPFFVQIPFRKAIRFTSWVQRNLSILVIVCLVILLLVAIAKNKTAILGDYKYLIFSFIIGMIVYALLYLIGGILYFKKKINRITTFSISSGQNNIGLGIALATIYFSPQIASFFIVAELAWIVIMFPVKYFFLHFSKSRHEKYG